LEMRIFFEGLTDNFNILILFLDCLLTYWGNGDINQVEFSSSLDLVLPSCGEVRNLDVLFKDLSGVISFVFKVFELRRSRPRLKAVS